MHLPTPHYTLLRMLLMNATWCPSATQFWGSGGPVNSIRAFVIQELLILCIHMRPGFVRHQKEPTAPAWWQNVLQNIAHIARVSRDQ